MSRRLASNTLNNCIVLATTSYNRYLDYDCYSNYQNKAPDVSHPGIGLEWTTELYNNHMNYLGEIATNRGRKCYHIISIVHDDYFRCTINYT